MRLVTFKVDADDSDAIGDEPIWYEGEVRGWITSGGYAHNAATSVAMGYVDRHSAEAAEGWSIELLGERIDARPLAAPLFDANAERMRG